MKLVMDMEYLFKKVTPELIAAVEANRQSSLKTFRNGSNWSWIYCIGRIHPKFGNKVLVGNQTMLLNCATFYIASNPAYRSVNPYVLLAAALQGPSQRVQAANPNRLSVIFLPNYTNEMAMDKLRKDRIVA